MSDKVFYYLLPTDRGTVHKCVKGMFVVTGLLFVDYEYECTPSILGAKRIVSCGFSVFFRAGTYRWIIQASPFSVDRYCIVATGQQGQSTRGVA